MYRYSCIFFVVMLVFSWSVSHAQLTFQIPQPSEEQEKEVVRLHEAEKFDEIEQFAKDENFDPRHIAGIVAFNAHRTGSAAKKAEAVDLLIDTIRSAPEDIQHKVAQQGINIMTGISPEWGDELFDELVRQEIYGENDVLLRKIDQMVRKEQVYQALPLFKQLLESSYSDEDMVNTAWLILSRMDYDSDDLPLSKKRLVEMLYEKFPHVLELKLKSIDALALEKPSEALVELERLKSEHPEFYAKYEDFVLTIRAQTLERMGEWERAKAEWTKALSTPAEEVAKAKLAEYARREEMEKQILELSKQVNDPQYELPLAKPMSWQRKLCIASGVLLILFAFFMRWRDHRKNKQS